MYPAMLHVATILADEAANKTSTIRLFEIVRRVYPRSCLLLGPTALVGRRWWWLRSYENPPSESSLNERAPFVCIYIGEACASKRSGIMGFINSSITPADFHRMKPSHTIAKGVQTAMILKMHVEHLHHQLAFGHQMQAFTYGHILNFFFFFSGTEFRKGK